MNKTFLAILTILVGSMTSPALGFNNGAPTMECFHCHTAIGEHRTELKIEGLPKTYKPGATYRLRIVLDSTQESFGQVQGGFAVEVSAGELLVTDGVNTQISERFLTHTQEGSALRTWKLSWKAPKEREDVEISVMATAANGDYSPVGDPIAAEIFTVTAKK